MSFQNCHIAAIGEKKSPGVSASIAPSDFRWRSNSPRSAYKIARCVAGLREKVAQLSYLTDLNQKEEEETFGHASFTGKIYKLFALFDFVFPQNI